MADSKEFLSAALRAAKKDCYSGYHLGVYWAEQWAARKAALKVSKWAVLLVALKVVMPDCTMVDLRELATDDQRAKRLAPN